jgi:hypothetical protein
LVRKFLDGGEVSEGVVVGDVFDEGGGAFEFFSAG